MYINDEDNKQLAPSSLNKVRITANKIYLENGFVFSLHAGLRANFGLNILNTSTYRIACEFRGRYYKCFIVVTDANSSAITDN